MWHGQAMQCAAWLDSSGEWHPPGFEAPAPPKDSMTSPLSAIAEAIEADFTRLCVLPDKQAIYLEIGPRRWSLTLKEITDGVADLDDRIGPPRRKEMGK